MGPRHLPHQRGRPEEDQGAGRVDWEGWLDRADIEKAIAWESEIAAGQSAKKDVPQAAHFITADSLKRNKPSSRAVPRLPLLFPIQFLIIKKTSHTHSFAGPSGRATGRSCTGPYPEECQWPALPSDCVMEGVLNIGSSTGGRFGGLPSSKAHLWPQVLG